MPVFVKVVEVNFCIIPGLLLSGLWVAWMGSLIYEECLQGSDCKSIKVFSLYVFHFVLSIVLFLSVFQVFVVACRWRSRLGFQGITMRAWQRLLISFGVFMTFVGILTVVLINIVEIKGDSYQIFSAYIVGLIVIVPAIHYLCADHLNANA